MSGRMAAALAAVLALAACGGGGGTSVPADTPEIVVPTAPEVEDSSTKPRSAPEPEPAPEPQPEPAPAPEPQPEPETAPEPRLERIGAHSSSSRNFVGIINGVPTHVTERTTSISGWGYWGRAGDTSLFRAGLTATITITNGVSSQSYSSIVTGSRSGTNPVSGPALWTGGVRSVDSDFTRVTGVAQFEVDFSDETVGIRFSDFDNGQADMLWTDLPLDNGMFRDGSGLEGAFYGSGHEGVAGKFNHNSLQGVFGAIRD